MPGTVDGAVMRILLDVETIFLFCCVRVPRRLRNGTALFE